MFTGLTRLAATRGRWVLAATMILFIVLAPWIWGVYGSLAAGGFTLTGGETARADAILDRQFPGAPPNVILVVTAPGSVDSPSVTRFGRVLADDIRREPGTSTVIGYWSQTPAIPSLRSRDGHSALVLVRLKGDERAVQKRAGQLNARYAGRSAGDITVRFGGEPPVLQEATEVSRTDLTRAEVLSAPLVFAVLLFAFGSVAAALLPVVVGVVSILGTVSLLRLLAVTTDVSVFSINVATALCFGLAVDYSLFLITRYREELAAGRPAPDALRRTLHTAGRTVLFSGLTVALSLAGTLAFPIFYLRSFGYAGIAVIVSSLLSALVVLPAALMVLGDKVGWGDVAALVRAVTGRGGHQGARHRPARHRPARATPSDRWEAQATRVVRRPVLWGLAALVVLIALAAPFRAVHPALPDDRILPTTSESYQANEALRTRFQECYPCHMTVVAPDVDPWTVPAALDSYARRLSAVPDVYRVDTATGSYSHGLTAVAPAVPKALYLGTGRGVWISVWMSTPDPTSDEARRAVAGLRAVPPPFHVMLDGLASQFAETRTAVIDRIPQALAIVMLSTLVLLFLFTGSVVVPLKALLLNSLSLGATYGALVLIFQDGHLRSLAGGFQVTGTLELTTPIMLFCVAFGLSMDYEIFVLARIREAYLRSGDNTSAVVQGLSRTGPLLTRLALAVIVVMLTMATSQIVIIKMIGIGLAAAVAFDVSLVRAVMLPSFMALAGRGNWWAPPVLRRVHARLGISEGTMEDDPPQAPPWPGTSPVPRRRHAGPRRPDMERVNA